MLGHVAIIGAPEDDEAGAEAGAVYLYDLDPAVPSSAPSPISIPIRRPSPRPSGGGRGSSSHDTTVVGTVSSPTLAPSSHTAAAPAGRGTKVTCALSVCGPRGHFGQAVAVAGDSLLVGADLAPQDGHQPLPPSTPASPWSSLGPSNSSTNSALAMGRGIVVVKDHLLAAFAAAGGAPCNLHDPSTMSVLIHV